jgi:acyl-CoA thioesterase FadM
MTVFPRVLGLLLGLPFRKRIKLTDTDTVALRPWPHEAGLGSMHHHSYLQMMEVGRWSLMLAAIGWNGMVDATRNGWVPVAASLLIRYRRPIRRFARFELHTKLACWDETDFFMEQTFLRHGELLARSVSRYRFPGGKTTKSPIEVFRVIGGVESPAVPEWVEQWRQTEKRVAPHLPAQL